MTTITKSHSCKQDGPPSLTPQDITGRENNFHVMVEHKLLEIDRGGARVAGIYDKCGFDPYSYKVSC